MSASAEGPLTGSFSPEPPNQCPACQRDDQPGAARAPAITLVPSPKASNASNAKNERGMAGRIRDKHSLSAHRAGVFRIQTALRREQAKPIKHCPARSGSKTVLTKPASPTWIGLKCAPPANAAHCTTEGFQRGRSDLLRGAPPAKIRSRTTIKQSRSPFEQRIWGVQAGREGVAVLARDGSLRHCRVFAFLSLK